MHCPPRTPAVPEEIPCVQKRSCPGHQAENDTSYPEALWSDTEGVRQEGRSKSPVCVQLGERENYTASSHKKENFGISREGLIFMLKLRRLSLCN